MLLGDHIVRQFGQSLWMIVSTISAKNWLSFTELKFLFGDPRLKQKFARKEQQSFHSLTGFDENKIQQLQGNAAIPLSLTETNTYIMGTCKLDDDFRYCPKCVTEGVHSPIHQIPSNVDCLWHTQRLKKGCPTCGARVLYRLDGDFARSPNSCVNGHEILRPKDRVTIAEFKTLMNRAPLRAYLSVVRKANSYLERDGGKDARPLLSDTPRHEQLTLFARRLGVKAGAAANVKKVADWRVGIQTTSYRFRLPRPKDATWEHRKLLETIRSDPEEAIVRLFNAHWLEKEFRESVYRVVRRLQETVLTGHEACWCLTGNARGASLKTGLSCVWATAFKLWRIRHEDCLYSKGRRVDRRHPYVVAWIDIANRYLVDPPPGWKRSADLRTFMFLARKYTEYSLRASYWSILRRLIAFTRFKDGFSFDELVQSTSEIQPNCIYTCKRSPTSGILTLWIDDEFGNREGTPKYSQATFDSCLNVPGDLFHWASADRHCI
jgi:hypothetical protein